MLSDRDRDLLFTAARTSIARAVGAAGAADAAGFAGLLARAPRSLRNRAGAFVTLRIGGELRGCIGFVEPACPLIETVAEAAARAAVEDLRFPPLTAEEFRSVEVEISVLSPLRRARSVGELEIGTHGIVVEAGRCRGLLLPQVAAEHGWTREEFASHASEKAGLPPEAWMLPGTAIWLFTAEILAEGAPAGPGRA